MDRHFSDRSVLVVDDEPVLIDVITADIRHVLGCNVKGCHSGEEALRFLAENDVDVMISDMVMPGIHGLELIQKAKEVRPVCDIIVITGYAQDFPFMSVIRAGASDFIAKPHSSDELCAKLVRILREQSLRTELADEKEELHRNYDELRKTKSAKSVAEEKYSLMFELSATPMAVLDAGGRLIEEVNEAFIDLTGLDKENLIHVPFLSLLDTHDCERFEMGLSALSGPGRGTLASVRMHHATGHLVWTDITVTFAKGDENILIITCKDVTEQRQMQDQLVTMATTDEMTGLYNRRTFQSRLESYIESAVQNPDKMLSLVYVDLDNFKQCNDTHGHQTGDELLQQIGQIIKKCIRTHDDGFRIGGDEFAIILQDIDAECAARAARRIQEVFAQGECYGTTMSMGVAQWLHQGDASDLVHRADTALYRAKDAGKDMICIA